MRRRAAPREEPLYGLRRPRPPDYRSRALPERDRAARSTTAGASVIALAKKKKKKAYKGRRLKGSKNKHILILPPGEKPRPT